MRTRACLLAILALFASGCRSSPPGSVRIDPALLTLTPPDTTMLAGIRMESVRNTPVFEKLIKQRKWPELEKFVDKTGLDPRQDIWEYLAASNGKDTVVMARGKFNPTGLEPRIEREGARRFSHKGYTMLGDDEMAVMFMNSSTAVAGPASALRGILDRRDQGTTVPKAFIEKVAAVPPEKHLWVVALGGSSPFPGPNLDRIFGMLTEFRLTADLSSSFQVTADGACATAEDAQKLQGALQGMVTLARLASRNAPPEMLQFYDSLQVRQNEEKLHLAADLPLELLEKLLAMLPLGGRNRVAQVHRPAALADVVPIP